MPTDLWDFFVNVVFLHSTLLAGCALTVLIGLYEKWKNKSISFKAYGKVISVLLLFACFQAWQQEHLSKRGREGDLHRQEALTSAVDRKRDFCETSLRLAENSLNINRGAMETRLSQLNVQQSTIQDCLLQLGKTQQQDPPRIVVLMDHIQPNPKIARWSQEVIAITNKTIIGVSGRLLCNKPFIQARVRIAGARAHVNTGVSKTADNTADFSVGSPNWTPTAPLILTIFYDDEELGQCGVYLNPSK